MLKKRAKDYALINTINKNHDFDAAIRRYYCVGNYGDTYLTQRELECLAWLSRGKTMEETSIILDVSRRTVEEHVARIKEKLGCSTLYQLGKTISDNELLNVWLNKVY